MLATTPDQKPISNALVRVNFEQSDGNQKTIADSTDTSGAATIEGSTRSSIGGGVYKNGYYRSTFSLPFATGQERITDDGRWLPWNPTIPVVLKPIREPTHMLISYKHLRIPRMDEPLGFDIMKHDWIPPDGEGEVTDMVISFEPIDGEPDFRRLVVEFPGKGNGGYVRKKDAYSILKSDYHAKTNGVYEARIENKNRKRGPAHVLLGNDDYLVFRIRSKVDHGGDLISAHYGKIYGPFDYYVASRFEIRLITFTNPLENDTNLEFDGRGYGEGYLFGR